MLNGKYTIYVTRGQRIIVAIHDNTGNLYKYNKERKKFDYIPKDENAPTHTLFQTNAKLLVAFEGEIVHIS